MTDAYKSRAQTQKGQRRAVKRNLRTVDNATDTVFGQDVEKLLDDKLRHVNVLKI
jgi:hypothetical protein